MKQKVYLFDFDGTLTSADTLIAFIRYACGLRRTLAGFALFSPLLVLMKLRLYPNYRAKERVFAWFFRGMPETEFDSLCRQFAHHSQRLLRPAALDKLREAFHYGQTVLVVSASVDNWVRPFFDSLAKGSKSDFKVIGTRIEVRDGTLTGHFMTHNCYGGEKVARLLGEKPELKQRRPDFYVAAYGDSRGDREMLAWADEAHYRPFRQK